MLTIDEIIDTLGGTSHVAAALGVRPATVSSWRKRGKFPAARYEQMQRTFHGRPIDPALWGMK